MHIILDSADKIVLPPSRGDERYRNDMKKTSLIKMPYSTIQQAHLSRRNFKKRLTKNGELQNYKNRVDVATRFSEAYYTGRAGMMSADIGTPSKHAAQRTRYGLQTAPGQSPPAGVRPRYYRKWKEVSLLTWPGSLCESKRLDQ